MTGRATRVFSFLLLSHPSPPPPCAEQIVIETVADRVEPLTRNKGRVVLTTQRIYFQPFNNVDSEPVAKFKCACGRVECGRAKGGVDEKGSDERKGRAVRPPCSHALLAFHALSHFRLEDVNNLVARRFMLRGIGIELMLNGGYSLYLAFGDSEARCVATTRCSFLCPAFSAACTSRAQLLLPSLSPLPPFLFPVPNSDTFLSKIKAQPALQLQENNERNMMLAWQNGAISNFDYLMFLNSRADRSFVDLAQYPVMPVRRRHARPSPLALTLLLADAFLFLICTFCCSRYSGLSRTTPATRSTLTTRLPSGTSANPWARSTLSGSVTFAAATRWVSRSI